MTTIAEKLRNLQLRSLPAIGSLVMPPSWRRGEPRPAAWRVAPGPCGWLRFQTTDGVTDGDAVIVRFGTAFVDDGAAPVLEDRGPDQLPLASYQGRQLAVVEANPERYLDRLRALPGMETIQGTRVLAVGCGSVGSDVGARLVRMGVSVVACDSDVLATENLVRWGVMASMDDVGLPKVRVWADALAWAVPGAKARGEVIDVVREADRFDAMIAEVAPHAIVVSTDTRDSRFTVAALAARRGIPVLFVALSDGAQSARLEWVPNQKDWACHQCSSAREGDSTPAWGKATAMPYATDNTQAAVPALGVNVALASTWASRVLVSVLAGQPWEPLFWQGEQRGNVMFLGLEPDSWLFDRPLDRVVYKAERFDDCPLCGVECGPVPEEIHLGDPE